MAETNGNGNGKGVLVNRLLVPAAQFFGAGVLLVTGALWVNTQLNSIEAKFTAVKAEIKDGNTEIKYRIDRFEERMQDRWSRTEMRQWVELARARNPTLSLPEVP